MKSRLSLLMITKNAEELLEPCLKSVEGLVYETIIIDNYSNDKTREIAKKFGAKVYLHEENDLGKQKAYGLKKVTGDWVLNLDSDEIVSPRLKDEIKRLKNYELRITNYSGFCIFYQNHFLGRPVDYGGENYKMLRLFKRNAVEIESTLVHEHFIIKKGKIGFLKHKILHYSYRTLFQTFKKFSDYSIREARQKNINEEKSSLEKIFLYPIHMFWARFIKDKGYKDGIIRIPLDLGFAYMEFLTYILLLFYNLRILNDKFQMTNK